MWRTSLALVIALSLSLFLPSCDAGTGDGDSALGGDALLRDAGETDANRGGVDVPSVSYHDGQSPPAPVPDVTDDGMLDIVGDDRPDTSGGSAPETSNGGGGPDVDPHCHYDCFGYATCVDGFVTVWEHVPVPCEYWEGECPIRETHECREGCGIDVVYDDPWIDPWELCAENQPDAVGDPCESDADCRPHDTVDNGDGTVTVSYLACDVDLGQCVEYPPPEIPGYLQQCGVEMADVGLGPFGYVEVSTCPGGLCLVSPNVDDECIAQGCTATCEIDQDCPQGSRCVNHLYNQTPDGVSGRFSVCKPGGRHHIGVDLACP